MNFENHIRLIEKILSNSASAQERNEFDSWLEESDDNQKLFRQMKIIWNRLGSTHDNYDFNEAAAKEAIISRIHHRHAKARALKKRLWISAAASILVFLSIGYLWYTSGNVINISQAYITYENEILEVVLPDNSQVWLNENSRLQVYRRFNKRQRKVILEGEAFFEVARDEQKVFKVSCGRTNTEVLGTSFNISSDEENNVHLSVTSGKVKFYNKFSIKEKKVFTAGSLGEYLSGKGKVLQRENDNLNYLSWKTGILTFSDTPLSEVCNVLSKQFKINIKSTEDSTNLSLTGTFNNEDLEDILSTIAITLDLKVTSSENGIVIGLSEYN